MQLHGSVLSAGEQLIGSSEIMIAIKQGVTSLVWSEKALRMECLVLATVENSRCVVGAEWAF